MGQLAVAENLGVGVVLLERLQQMPEGGLLLRRAGVGRVTVGKQTALVADADGMGVVVAGVGTGEVLMTGLVKLAVAGDVVVVAGETETGRVAGNQRLHRERTVLARRTAMNDNQINLSHKTNGY